MTAVCERIGFCVRTGVLTVTAQDPAERHRIGCGEQK
jgi:hypothetical protein